MVKEMVRVETHLKKIKGVGICQYRQREREKLFSNIDKLIKVLRNQS